MEEEVVDALGRPRLEALRKQLSQEDRETPELKGAINHQTNKQNRKNSSSIELCLGRTRLSLGNRVRILAIESLPIL